MGSLLENQIAQAVFSGLKTGGLSLRGKLYRPVTTASSVLDDNGEPVVPAPVQYDCEGFLDNYKPFIRQRDGIPLEDVKVCIYGASLTGTYPKKDDIVHFQNKWYQLRKDATDPAGALWECQAFVCPAPVVAAALAASSALLEGGISQSVFSGLKSAGLALAATLFRPVTNENGTLDANGELTDPNPVSYSCFGFTDKFTDGFRKDGAPIADALVYIYGWSLPAGTEPRQDDKVNIRGHWYQLRNCPTDPAKALWQCEGFVTTAPVIEPVEIIAIVTQRFRTMTQFLMASPVLTAEISQSFGSLDQAVIAFQPITAAIDQSFAPISQSLSAGQFVSAEIVQSFEPLVQVAMGSQYLSAILGQTLSAMSQGAFGYQPVVAQVDQAFQPLTQALTADTTGQANIYQTFNGLSQDLAATQYVVSSVDQSFSALLQTAVATQYLSAQIDQTFSSLSQGLTASQVITAEISQSFSAITQAAIAGQYIESSVTQSFGAVQQSISATQYIAGSIDQSFSALTQDISAGQYLAAAIDQSFSGMEQSLVAGQYIVASIEQSFGAMTQAAVAGQYVSSSIDQTFAAMTQALDASQSSALVAEIDQTFGAMTQAAVATQYLVSSVTQSFGSMTQSLIASATLWSLSDLGVTPYWLFDPTTASWSGSNFSSAPNTGSVGGTYAIGAGTPTKAAASIGGYDALTVSSSGIYLATKTIPAGDRVSVYLRKHNGVPPSGFGVMHGQTEQQPGWAVYDQINTTASFSTGDSVAPGDAGSASWPTGSNNFEGDYIVTPPTEDNAYHMVINRQGLSPFWRHDGAVLSQKYSTPHSIPSITGHIVIGINGLGQGSNATIALDMCLPATVSSDDILRIEGYISWHYKGDGSLISDALHKYKNIPPMKGI